MSKNLLVSTPLSALLLLRRGLRTSIPLLSLRSTPHLHSLSSFSPSLFYCFPDSSSLYFPSTSSFLEILKFSGKLFCSESADSVVGRCWNCRAAAETAPFLVCDSCRSVQPVDQSVDYFLIFGLERSFDIAVENLEGKYKGWQKKLHPDLVHSKSEREREYAAEQSARVIDAYQTLSKPLLRAIYILRLQGVDVDEEKTVSDPKLLAEILEIREAVEEAADTQALNQIKSQIQEKLQFWSKSFSNAFQRRNFEEAQTSIQRMTYYDRVNDEIVKKL
ncbi:iron-sulfur cluster co-chaperone protein HscB homolog [Malania oleifera]|uniref:iron-sulfur cluster co-chaperone protein HscB homolog n=1 Tax=Malania oleifera TaxID=397392 RepID=UPI0025AE9BD7|nr:iron-sulfur cluster co-chaperone protein HscB homolog [Malania oleifera]